MHPQDLGNRAPSFADVSMSRTVDKVSVYPTSGICASANDEVKCGGVNEDPARLVPSRLRSLLARHELDLRQQQVGGNHNLYL